jgi:hypothetical protein
LLAASTSKVLVGPKGLYPVKTLLDLTLNRTPKTQEFLIFQGPFIYVAGKDPKISVYKKEQGKKQKA